MARLSDMIETVIKEMLDRNDGLLDTTRSALADRFNCAPSQITYVLSTRFGQDHGYVIESRRGGGGWIRIQRMRMEGPSDYLVHAFFSLGDALSQEQAMVHIQNFVDHGAASPDQAVVMRSAVSDRSLARVNPPWRDALRADILKNLLAGLIRCRSQQPGACPNPAPPEAGRATRGGGSP